MVIGHEITHGFDDNGEKTAEKVLFLQVHSSHCKKFRLQTAGPGAPVHTGSRARDWGLHQHTANVPLSILQRVFRELSGSRKG